MVVEFKCMSLFKGRSSSNVGRRQDERWRLSLKAPKNPVKTEMGGGLPQTMDS